VTGARAARRKASAETFAEARTRHERAKADAVEMENAERRRDLLPAGEVEMAWAATLGRCRQLLLGIPSALADEVVLLVRRHDGDEQAAVAVREKLRAAIHAALTELSNVTADDGDEEGEG
jgi:hypothetical protein